MDSIVGQYDDGDGSITISELGDAAADYAQGQLSITALGNVAAAYASGGRQSSTGGTVQVTRVVDGDTIEIHYQNGSTDTVPLIGVDTPEVHTSTDPGEFEGIPDSQTGRDWLRGWGHNASAYTKRVVNGTSVTLCFDSQTDRRGAFGRLLAYVQVNQSYTLNTELVKNGYARVYRASNFTRKSAYLTAESDAQSNTRGLWGFTGESDTDSGPGENGTVSLSIVEINADAPGNDNTNPNGEYVVIKNTGNETADLTSFSVTDEANHRYRFPAEFTLAAGARVTLYTGSGTDSETDLYWGQGSAVWNNDGDTVTIRNGTGAVVTNRSYN